MSVLIAILTVGFVMVFLGIAKDIRDITSYIYIIGAMMIEDKNQKEATDIEALTENIPNKSSAVNQQEEK